MWPVKLHAPCVEGGSESAVTAGNIGDVVWRQGVERCLGKGRGMCVSCVATER